jgi:hypothetical protein
MMSNNNFYDPAIHTEIAELRKEAGLEPEPIFLFTEIMAENPNPQSPFV